jgi:hypothetical protein
VAQKERPRTTALAQNKSSQVETRGLFLWLLVETGESRTPPATRPSGHLGGCQLGSHCCLVEMLRLSHTCGISSTLSPPLRECLQPNA